MAADTFVSGSGIDVCRNREKGVQGIFLGLSESNPAVPAVVKTHL